MANDPYPTQATTFGLVLGCLAGALAGGVASAASVPTGAVDWAWNAGHIESDVASLPDLEVPVDDGTATPTLGAFLRSNGETSGESDRLGNGGVDLRWRANELFDVAVVLGAAMEVDPSNTGTDLTRAISNRSAAFADFDFGGRSARDARPFDLNAALGARSDLDDIDATFLAVRASVRPSDRTRIGVVATASGDTAGIGLVGVDVAQRFAGHEVRGWLQQRTGFSPDSEESDRSALGVSIGGRIEELEYEMDWRRIGDGFDSDVGSVRAPGSHALAGRFGWGVDLDSSELIRRVAIGVRGRIESDLDLTEQRLDLSWNALTLTMNSGDRISVRVDQFEHSTDSEVVSNDSWFLLEWSSSDRLPIQVHNQIGFGDRDDASGTAWRTTTRWRATQDVEITGDVHWSRYIVDDVEDDRDHLRTSLGAGLGLGGDATSRTSVVLDTSAETCSLRQSVGWRIGGRSEVDIAIEHRIPTTPVGRPAEIRARIGGRFVF